MPEKENLKFYIRRCLIKLYKKLLPERSDRTEPRVIKRRKKSYPLMTKPRNPTKPQIAA